MEEAARFYRLGRLTEKGKRFDVAIRWYERAEAMYPDNEKIAEALKRVRALKP